MSQERAKAIILKGGLDLSTPVLAIKPGACRDMVNFEPSTSGGYRRVMGYERYDGQSAPSDAQYYLMVVDDTSALAVGDVIDGHTSLAQGTVVALTATEVIFTEWNTKNFVATEHVDVGGVQKATCVTPQLLDGEPDRTIAATYLLAAQDYYRNLIGPVDVGGDASGSVLGVWEHDGTTYAFRNNAAGTAQHMYKSSSSGWVKLTLKSKLFFDTWDAPAGTEILVGDTILGRTSGATAVVRKIVHNYGTFGSNAAGYFIVDTIVGTFQAEVLENNASPGTRVCDIQGDATAITIAVPNAVSTPARYQFISRNFYGQSQTYRLYGCDGQNPAFEYDAVNDIYCPILMPSENPAVTIVPGEPEVNWNKPKYISHFAEHLFLGFYHGSVQHSTPGEPVIFSGFLDASEFGLGDECTGMQELDSGALALFTRRKTYALYGTSVADWSLKVLSSTTGALPYSTVMFGIPWSWDDRGILRTDRVEAWGNFEASTVTRKIDSLLGSAKTQVDTLADNMPGFAVSVVREKNLIRYHLPNGEVIVMAVVSDKEVEFGRLATPFYGANAIQCTSNSEDADGNEKVLVGSANGYVYQLEKGNSFDGAEIPFYLSSHYESLRSPHIRKAFRKLAIQVQTESLVSFNVSHDLAYGTTDVQSTVPQVIDGNTFGWAKWGEVSWAEFSWGSGLYSERNVKLDGRGTNISILIQGSSATMDAFTLESFLFYYIRGRIDRG